MKIHLKSLFCLFTLSLFFVAATTTAQITLPTFTTYTACPTSWSQLNSCPGWRQPTAGTSDYFNVCASPTNVGVPLNYFGYQHHPDSAYAGLYTYVNYSVFDYREYIAASFAPLTIGKAYSFSVNISLSDSSECATDGLGVFFATFPYNDQNTMATLPVTPQIDFSGSGIIADKINWVTLTGTFVADSAYTDLIFGSFKTYSAMAIDTLDKSAFNLDAYYYFSQITLADTADLHPPKDTTGYAYPNAFTPNGDGNNDLFRIIGKLITYDNYSLGVYNRWGRRVFHTANPSDGWDGIFNGQPQDVGVYFYLAEFTIKGKRHLVKGDVTLVR